MCSILLLLHMASVTGGVLSTLAVTRSHVAGTTATDAPKTNKGPQEGVVIDISTTDVASRPLKYKRGSFFFVWDPYTSLKSSWTSRKCLQSPSMKLDSGLQYFGNIIYRFPVQL